MNDWKNCDDCGIPPGDGFRCKDHATKTIHTKDHHDYWLSQPFSLCMDCWDKRIEKRIADAETINTKPNVRLIDFGDALYFLKKGKKLARQGWNGLGMWVVLMPELQLPAFNSQEPGAKVNDRTAKYIGENTPLHSQSYIAMWTAQGKWQPGWLASQSDILAEDWYVVEN